uniref:Uncharacterized protein n=1 Tax=Caenorhabditis tropicalis TaxID=1561998 RepID=A0A1I7UIJ7_9PELO
MEATIKALVEQIQKQNQQQKETIQKLQQENQQLQQQLQQIRHQQQHYPAQQQQYLAQQQQYQQFYQQQYPPLQQYVQQQQQYPQQQAYPHPQYPQQTQNPIYKCRLCGQMHKARECYSLTVTARREKAVELGMCFVCLSPHAHSRSNCLFNSPSNPFLCKTCPETVPVHSRNLCIHTNKTVETTEAEKETPQNEEGEEMEEGRSVESMEAERMAELVLLLEEDEKKET